MEVDGKEFLRNVGIEQDKERLIQEQKKLEELKRASVKREKNYIDNNGLKDDESAFVDLSIGNDSPPQDNGNSVDDIILDTSTQNNKKKYIMLGVLLILLFIVTILVIRVVLNKDIEAKLDDINTNKTEVIKEDILNKIDSNDEYQKKIEKEKALEESKIDTQKQEINEIIIPEKEVSDVPLVLDTPKQEVRQQRDLFELDKKTQKVLKEKQEAEEKRAKEEKQRQVQAVKKQAEKKQIKKQVVQKVQQPKIVSKAKKEKGFVSNAKSLKGYYIQIGAFTKAPSKKLLDSILKKGYSFTIYRVKIKGKMYNKVLIGSYKTKSVAIAKLDKIISDFRNPHAYILKF